MAHLIRFDIQSGEEEAKEERARGRKDSIFLTHEHEDQGKGPHHNDKDELKKIDLKQSKPERRRNETDSIHVLHEHEKLGKGLCQVFERVIDFW